MRAPGGAAEHLRLAGHDLRHRVADLLRVGVHQPGHLALARRHVGRRDVAIRTEDRRALRRVAAHDPLHLAVREPVRVAADAALGAAEGQPQQRALEGHPHRQRRALPQRDAGREADAALGRAHDEGVLHPVARHLLHLPVVAANREVDDQRAARLGQALPHVGLEVEHVGGPLELLERHAVELRPPLRPGRDVVRLGLEDLVPASRPAILRAVHESNLTAPSSPARDRPCRRPRTPSIAPSSLRVTPMSSRPWRRRCFVSSSMSNRTTPPA